MTKEILDTVLSHMERLSNVNDTHPQFLGAYDFLSLHFLDMAKESLLPRPPDGKPYPLEDMFLRHLTLLANLQYREDNVLVINNCMNLIGYHGYDDSNRVRQYMKRLLGDAVKALIRDTTAPRFSCQYSSD